MAVSLSLIHTLASILAKFIPLLIHQKLLALSHRFTYHSVPNPLNILIIGGSYAGIQLAHRLAETLPTGYHVILVERHPHFHHLFNFPRYAVAQGREIRAFIPYDGLGKGFLIPKGIFERVEGEVVRIKGNEVQLENGECVPFALLAVCTGATLSSPATLSSLKREDGCAELREWQGKIEKAEKIAVVGGGAVGVQIAGDVKSLYKEKEVTLVHSREWLLSGFGKVLGERVGRVYEGMGIRILLGERPVLDGKDELVFKNGRRESFDLVIKCTGQIPNSSLIEQSYPDSISKTTGEILVLPTLQLATPSSLSPNSTSKPNSTSTPSNIFALGDVALTHGPKMARASFFQAEIVIANILSLISNPETPYSGLRKYVPMAFEGIVNLSLGMGESVGYLRGGKGEGEEFLWEGKGKGVDLEVRKMWWMLGVGGRYESETEVEEEIRR